MKLMFPVLINHLINRFRIIHNEPFGLGRFAMDHPSTLSQRPLRGLCSFLFGATRLKSTFENIILEISMPIIPLIR